jgi:hypothetical protein
MGNDKTKEPGDMTADELRAEVMECARGVVSCMGCGLDYAEELRRRGELSGTTLDVAWHLLALHSEDARSQLDELVWVGWSADAPQAV